MGKIEWYSREDSYTNDYAPTAKISAISDNTTVAPDCRIAFFTGQNGSIDEKMCVDSSGRVGIGRSSPQAILNIYTANPKLIIQDTETSSPSADSCLIFSESNGNGDVGHNYRIRYNHRDLIFSEGDGVDSTNKTEVMRFHEATSGGEIRVGIGTTSPEGLLHINRATQESGIHNVLYLESNTSGGSPNHNHGPQIMFQTKWTSGNIWRTAAIAGTVYNSGGGGALKFYTAAGGGASGGYSSNVPTERMLIDRDGKVGIGAMTAVPTQFYVWKDGSQEPLCRFESGGDCAIRVEGPGGEVYLEIANTGSSGNTSNSWGIGTNDDNNLHIAYGTNSTMNKTDKMIILNNGRVGIGTTSPRAGLEVTTTAGTSGNSGVDDNSVSYLSYYGSTSVYNYDFNSNSYTVSIIGKGLVYAEKYVGASDERIKKNIVEVNDQQALQKVRDISCCWYEYKDEILKGKGQTIGFIAQQVKLHIPEAVQEMNDFIPNEMRNLDVSWNGLEMSCNLTDVSGVKYRFYVSNDISGNNECIKEIVGNSNNTFTFDTSYNNVFCYGKEINDFCTLDKQKLFALNFSATQEIDRIQQAEKTKLAAAEAEIVTLKNKVTSLETTVADLISRITALESQ